MVERETPARNKQVMKRLLAEPGNKHCADCKTATHPRWASWNLGIFLCIRCSGVHRSLGTHITKVRSVDLDSWSDMHLKEMVRWGNRRANMYWEAKLPENHVPDESKIFNFIKTKYDLRRWVASPTLPDPATLDGGDDVPLSTVKREVAAEGDRRPARPPIKTGSVSLLNDFSPAPPTSATSWTTAGPNSGTPSKTWPSTSLLDLDGVSNSEPTSSSRPAAVKMPVPPRASFGAPTSKPPAANSRDTPKATANPPGPGGPGPQKAASPPLGNQGTVTSSPGTQKSTGSPTATTPAPHPRADLKKTILSLYAQKPVPPESQPLETSAQGVQATPTVHTSTSPPLQRGGVSSSSTQLDSLFDFGPVQTAPPTNNTTARATSHTQAKRAPMPPAQPKRDAPGSRTARHTEEESTNAWTTVVDRAPKAPAPSQPSLIDSFEGLSFNNTSSQGGSSAAASLIGTSAPATRPQQPSLPSAAPEKPSSNALLFDSPGSSNVNIAAVALDDDDLFANVWS